MGSHCNITGSLTASLHPLVIMNISEHWTRLKAQNSEEQQVVGALIGKQEGRNIEIMNSFELLFDRVEMDIIIDKTYYLQKENQFKQVFPDLDFLGWYTTGDTPDDSDIKVHQQICEINESPVLLKLNPYSRHTKLPVKMFETIIDIVSGEPKMLFVDLNYTIKTEEAERIGLDHVAKLSATPDVALITYLSTLTKASNTLNQSVNKFNILYDRQGMGRRIRALFM